jgi:hypothetical protein
VPAETFSHEKIQEAVILRAEDSQLIPPIKPIVFMWRSLLAAWIYFPAIVSLTCFSKGDGAS